MQFPPAPTYQPKHQYTLDELVQLSVFRNASLDVSRYEAEAAQGLVDQVKALWLPAIRYDFAATAYSNDFSYHARAFHLATINVPITGAYNITNNVNLSQIAFTGGKRTSGLKQAKMFAALKKIDIERQRDAIAFDVATYYQLVCLANDVDAELEQLQILVRAGRQQAYTAMKQAVGLLPDEPLVLRQASLPPLVTPQERQSVIAGVIIDVPVYDPARRGRLHEAMGFEQAALAFQRQVEELITLEIDVTAIDAQKTLATVARAAQARQTAAEHLGSSRQAYSRELIPASGVVLAMGIDALGKIGYSQALFAYHNARANLRRVTADRETQYGY